MPTLNQYNVNRNGGYLEFSIIDNPIVEPLDGPLYVDHLMQRFPETVYNRSRETHLYRFLSALVGDAGAGQLKKQSLFARMKYEANLLSYQDLDGAYKSFGFSRLPNETYKISPNNSYLTSEEWDAIRAADMSYRRRIMDFYQSTRYGNSLEGMRLAAKAGSGQEMRVTENYRAIFDQLSDRPLGIRKSGNTDSVSEFVVQPTIEQNRNNTERYATLGFTEPESGYANTDYITLSYNNAESTSKVYLKNISSGILQSTIEGFEIVNLGDVQVTQVTSSSYQIKFVREELNIANVKISQASLLSGATAQISYSFVDSAFYSTDFGEPNHEYYDDYIQGVVSSEELRSPETTIWLDPSFQRNMNDVLDRLKPVSSIATIKSTEQREIAVPINAVHGSSEKFTINRFIKGDPSLTGFEDDPINGLYIKSGVEREERAKPYAAFDISVISITVSNIVAYKGNAIFDPQYNSPAFYDNLYQSEYISYRNGGFDPNQLAIFPFLNIAPSSKYDAERALPDETTQLISTVSPVL